MYALLAKTLLYNYADCEAATQRKMTQILL